LKEVKQGPKIEFYNLGGKGRIQLSGLDGGKSRRKERIFQATVTHSSDELKREGRIKISNIKPLSTEKGNRKGGRGTLKKSH